MLLFFWCCTFYAYCAFCVICAISDNCAQIGGAYVFTKIVKMSATKYLGHFEFKLRRNHFGVCRLIWPKISAPPDPANAQGVRALVRELCAHNAQPIRAQLRVVRVISARKSNAREMRCDVRRKKVA